MPAKGDKFCLFLLFFFILFCDFIAMILHTCQSFQCKYQIIIKKNNKNEKKKNDEGKKCAQKHLKSDASVQN